MINGEEVRDGEHLHNALEDARRRLNEWKQKATTAQAEVERWDDIVRGLEELENRTRQPAKLKAAANPISIAGSKGVKKRPRGFWKEQIEIVLGEWGYPGEIEVGPTKKQLIGKLQRKFPDASDLCIQQAMYGLINKVLIYRVDHLYVPGNAPAKQLHATA